MIWVRRLSALLCLLGGAGCAADNNVVVDPADQDSAIADAAAADAKTNDAGNQGLDAQSNDGALDSGRDGAVADGSAEDSQTPDLGLDAMIHDGGRDAQQPVACGDAPQGTAVCGAQCGDGVRSTCRLPLPNEPCCGDADAGIREATEECDQDDHGDVTCRTLGYVGGELTCSDGCFIDRRTCTFCVDHPRLTACGLATEPGFVPVNFSLALGDRIAVAWIGNAVQGRAAFFSTYAADTLEPIDTLCLGLHAGVIAVEAMGDELWVAVGDVRGNRPIRLTRLSVTGEVLGQVPVVEGKRVTLHPVDGGLIMVWTSNDNHSHARFIDANGRVTWTTQIFDVEQGHASVVEVPDGYLMAQRTTTMREGERHRGIVVARLSARGELQGYVYPLEESTEFPSLAADGNELRMTYTSFAEPISLNLATLDSRGNLVRDVRLGAMDFFNPSPTIVIGRTSFVLNGQFTRTANSAGALRLLQLDANGAPEVPMFDLTQSGVFAGSWQIVDAGDAFIVAWIETGTGLALARVTR